MKGYCTINDLKNYNLTDIESSFNPQIEQWIGVAESIIENETGRIFIADTTSSERLFDGRYGNAVIIDDCVSVTSVSVYHKDGTLAYAFGTDDFVLSPYNTLPKTKVILKPKTDGAFIDGNANVTVTAKWGYSVTVPADITYATTVIASGIMNVGNDAPGEKQTEKIGDYTVTFKTDDQWNDLKTTYAIIERYKSAKLYV